METFKCICDCVFLKLSGGCKRFIILFFIALSILKDFIINNSLSTIIFFPIRAVQLSSYIREILLLKLEHEVRD